MTLWVICRKQKKSWEWLKSSPSVCISAWLLRKDFLLVAFLLFFCVTLRQDTSKTYRTSKFLYCQSMPVRFETRSCLDFSVFVPVRQVAAVCRGMMLEISALQAQVAHMEEEKRTLEEQLSLKLKERYDPLVRHLSSTCIQLKVWSNLDWFLVLKYIWQSSFCSSSHFKYCNLSFICSSS